MSKKKTDSDKKKTQEEIFDEIRDLVNRANETTADQAKLFSEQELGDEDIDVGFDSSIIKDTADPDRSYKLYYGIRRLLMDYLPKGKSNKELRQKVYDEKNLFLNRGESLNEQGVRGSDGRMTYISTFLEIAFNTVAKWVSEGANPYDIWQSFYDLNEEKGFHNGK